MASIVSHPRRSTMNTRSTLRALRDIALVGAASLAAASIWATGLPEDGYLVDAELWQDEVAAASETQWPTDGWYRIAPQGRDLEVRQVQPGQGDTVPADALFFRLPGATLKQGLRPVYQGKVLAQPKLDTDYELTLGKTRFGLRVENVVKGMQYAFTYGSQTYTYVLGPFDATSTSVRAVADLDGDSQPDFLIDVGDDATYLLLSTRARPGHNLPTAELWAKGC
jgi:hypothetical protein